MKIHTKLSPDEVQNLFDLLNHAVIENGPEAKLNFLSGAISEGEYEWRKSHRLFLIQMGKKLGFTNLG